MNSIEREVVISKNGRLPQDYREAFGRKVRGVVYWQEDELQSLRIHRRLMSLAGKIHAFQDVDDPIGLQRELRNSWKHGLDQRLPTASWWTPKPQNDVTGR